MLLVLTSMIRYLQKLQSIMCASQVLSGEHLIVHPHRSIFQVTWVSHLPLKVAKETTGDC